MFLPKSFYICKYQTSCSSNVIAVIGHISRVGSIDISALIRFSLLIVQHWERNSTYAKYRYVNALSKLLYSNNTFFLQGALLYFIFTELPWGSLLPIVQIFKILGGWADQNLSLASLRRDTMGWILSFDSQIPDCYTLPAYVHALYHKSP